MNKINKYLFFKTNKYLFLNFCIISILILFINFIELSRIIPEDNKNVSNFFYLSVLKFPSVLNEIIPFVTIISITFLVRNLVNNNEFISMRNIGYSIFDIFKPIAVAIFIIGLFFLFVINPISIIFENSYNKKLNQNNYSPYSIKIVENQMWIKNEINEENYSFIILKEIDLKNMNVDNINIILINEKSKQFINAKQGIIKNNLLELKNVNFYDFKYENFENIENFNFIINFNQVDIINSINKFKLIPFYNYFSHINTLTKFNLYSPEIGLFYLSEVLKPLFLVMLSFVIIGISGKFKRNENFFKTLFISILIGFSIFLFKEIVTKFTVSLSINFFISYLIIFLFPFFIGLYLVIRIEND